MFTNCQLCDEKITKRNQVVICAECSEECCADCAKKVGDQVVCPDCAADMGGAMDETPLGQIW